MGFRTPGLPRRWEVETPTTKYQAPGSGSNPRRGSLTSHLSLIPVFCSSLGRLGISQSLELCTRTQESGESFIRPYFETDFSLLPDHPFVNLSHGHCLISCSGLQNDKFLVVMGGGGGGISFTRSKKILNTTAMLADSSFIFISSPL